MKLRLAITLTHLVLSVVLFVSSFEIGFDDEPEVTLLDRAVDVAALVLSRPASYVWMSVDMPDFAALALVVFNSYLWGCAGAYIVNRFRRRRDLDRTKQIFE